MMSASEPIAGLLLSPRRRFCRHALLQAAVLCITLNSFWDVPDHLILTPLRFWGWLGYFLTINAAIYVNIYVLTPRFLLKNRLPAYVLSVFLLTLFALCAVVMLQFLCRVSTSGARMSLYFSLLNLVSGILSVSMLMAGLSALLLYRHWLGYTRRISELESATLQAELKYLKSQINPHFLFNMLNNANVLVRRNPAEATQVLFRLEDLLRYQFRESSPETVLLSSEIAFLNDFLGLEKIRRDRFSFRIRQEGDTAAVRIPPLLFIPFVENAVKYNLSGDADAYVHLAFRATDRQLCFSCENPVPEDKDALTNRAGGLGLKNIRRRLELLFPGCHTLETDESGGIYSVRLNITLN